jgi:hypothetical protein
MFLLGIAFMRYSVQITNVTGKFEFAEKYLGGGLLSGTYTFYKLLGLGLTILGALWFFGLTDVITTPLAHMLVGH